jgi:hypothetical protein
VCSSPAVLPETSITRPHELASASPAYTSAGRILSTLPCCKSYRSVPTVHSCWVVPLTTVYIKPYRSSLLFTHVHHFLSQKNASTILCGPVPKYGDRNTMCSSYAFRSNHLLFIHNTITKTPTPCCACCSKVPTDDVMRRFEDLRVCNIKPSFSRLPTSSLHFH